MRLCTNACACPCLLASPVPLREKGDTTRSLGSASLRTTCVSRRDDWIPRRECRISVIVTGNVASLLSENFQAPNCTLPRWFCFTVSNCSKTLTGLPVIRGREMKETDAQDLNFSIRSFAVKMRDRVFIKSGKRMRNGTFDRWNRFVELNILYN